MIKLAITGGIGSGKSYIARQMHDLLGIPVYDCDSEAKRLNVESEVIRRGLTELVGKRAYNEDGSLNRKAVADYLFESREHADRINALVHPVVIEDFLRWAEAQNAKVVAIETALLGESGIDKIVDKVIRVDAPLEIRIQRAMQRDDCSREKVIERINRQTEYPNPDIIINN